MKLHDKSYPWMLWGAVWSVIAAMVIFLSPGVVWVYVALGDEARAYIGACLIVIGLLIALRRLLRGREERRWRVSAYRTHQKASAFLEELKERRSERGRVQ